MNKFYVTTPIYYANGLPHIGHFLTTTAADVVARYYRGKYGKENVFFTTGLDEHGTTVEQAAAKNGYTLDTIQGYVDTHATEWQKAFDSTDISYDYFVRTTNPEHEKFAQEFIQKIKDDGYIYENTYKGKYCTGCEKFLTLSDLNEEGYCPLHRPDQTIETEEKNYFFKLSAFKDQLIELITSGKFVITPEGRKHEILARLKGEVDDVSISRPKSKVAWGISFPGDDDQTIYVWVEALINYASSLKINNKDKEFWTSCWHFLAKDISWFHNVIWPAMLIAAGYELPKGTFVHSYLQIGGEKISKSKGNVITPQELVEKYGIDGARYLILTSFPYENDADVNWNYLDTKYTADLSNGLGNLVSRLAKLCEINAVRLDEIISPHLSESIQNSYSDFIESFQFHNAFEHIWKDITRIDQELNQTTPWKLDPEAASPLLSGFVRDLTNIAYALQPFLPETAEKIIHQFTAKQIVSGPALFPRLA